MGEMGDKPSNSSPAQDRPLILEYRYKPNTMSVVEGNIKKDEKNTQKQARKKACDFIS